MKASRRGRKSILLGGLCLLVLAFVALLYTRPTLTGSLKGDGIIGVLFGLYICSHPVANVLDVILFGRFFQQEGFSIWLECLWWCLNLLVLLAGWSVIYLGMLRFTTR